MKVPTQLAIDNDIERILKKLNAKVNLKSKDELIYEFLVQCWTGRTGKPPTATEVATKAGVEQNTAYHVFRRLVKSGKVRKLAKGIYIPLGGKDGGACL